MTRTIRMKDITGLKANTQTAPYATTEPTKIGGVRGGGSTPTPSGGLFDVATGLTYLGAFRIDHSDAVSSTDYNSGRIGFRPSDGVTNGQYGSLYVDSINADAIAEFDIPALSSSGVRTELPLAPNVQGYKLLNDLFPDSNGRDRIGYIGFADNRLFVGTYKVYDNSGSVENVVIFNDPANLTGSAGQGPIEVQGHDRTVSYFAPIPSEWQSTLGGTHMLGNGAGMSIDSRYSHGPSLYAFNPSAIASSDALVSTTEHLNFTGSQNLATNDYVRPTGWVHNSTFPDYDQFNEAPTLHYLNQLGFATYEEWRTSSPRTDWSTLTSPDPAIVNDLWVNNCYAAAGVIVPGTRTFLAIGLMNGRRYGNGYKITSFQGNTGSGGGPLDETDRDNWFWAFDLDEVMAATAAWTVNPYARGVFDNNRWLDTSVKDAKGRITGGAYDAQNNKLYVAQKFDTSGDLEILVSVYSLGVV